MKREHPDKGQFRGGRQGKTENAKSKTKGKKGRRVLQQTSQKGFTEGIMGAERIGREG